MNTFKNSGTHGPLPGQLQIWQIGAEQKGLVVTFVVVKYLNILNVLCNYKGTWNGYFSFHFCLGHLTAMKSH